MSALVELLLRWSTQLVETLGYAGLAAVMLLESLFPPLPSEPFLLAAGLASARGTVSAPGAVLAATLGTTVGATAWYYLARLVPQERLRGLLRRHGRWLLLQERDLDRALGLFARHRRTAVVTGRFLPVGRMLVSLPAGSSRMPLPEFLLATALGSAVWSALLIGGGRALGDASALAQLERYDRLGSLLLGALAVLLVALLAVRRVRAREQGEQGAQAGGLTGDAARGVPPPVHDQRTATGWLRGWSTR